MTKKQTLDIVKQLSLLSSSDRNLIVNTPDGELPEVLKELGISLPSSNWLLRVLKIILYALGIVLAGVGTASASTFMFNL